MKKKLKFWSKLATNITAIVCAVCITGGNILLSPDVAGQLNSLLNVSTQVIESDNASSKNTTYFNTKYTSIQDLHEDIGETITRISEEGCVLLKNDNNALPLTSTAKVNLYSSSSVNYVYSGGGSSWNGHAEFTDLKAGLESAGLVVNEDLWNFYQENKSYSGAHNSTTGSDAASYQINDASWDALPEDAKEAEAEAGIFVLSRYGTEGTDPYFSGGAVSNFNKNLAIPEDHTDTTNGDYLSLSPNEISVLKGMKALKDSGKLDKIIVLLNSANQVQCDYINNPEFGIDAILWVGEGGSTGTVAIGRILTGQVNPSGRLTDTYWVNHAYNPVYANFGEYKYTGETMPGGTKSQSYVVYQEGIYNGYRYTETRYEDVVLGTPNVGEFDYSKVVAYPFGYGLSYTAFEYSDFSVVYNVAKDEYTATVTVKNIGSVAGKEAVQIYLQKPYTQYDRDNGVEKAAIELVGYTKTDILAPGATQTVSVKVDGKWLASYDAYNAKTYIIENGIYYFTAAKNAHDAINNVLELKSQTVHVNKDKMTAAGNADLAAAMEVALPEDTYSVASTGKLITNQFENADINLYEGRGDNAVTYLTRKDWAGTVKFGMDENHNKLQNHVTLIATAQMVLDGQKGSEKIQQDDLPYPAYGDGTYEKTIMSLLTTDEKGNLLRVSYDDPRWEELLDSLTWEDTVKLLSNGLRKTIGIDIKPETVDLNGALGPTGYRNGGYGGSDNVATNRFAFLYGDPDTDSFPLCYPCAALTASTMNDALAKELGDGMGEDCLWLGFSGIYGPGLNIHRGQYNGRAFEYYSEDALLSGYICAAQLLGMRSHGVYTYAKHCLLNDQEHNREGVCTWANEQTIRENYLRAFEIAIEVGGNECVMTGFNRLGAVWTGAQGFVETVLRQEFGMEGFAVSDYWQGGYMDLVGSILGGSAIPDGDTALDPTKSQLYQYGPENGGYGGFAQMMREQCHRIMYMTVNSNAMNGYTAGARFRTITPAWMIAVEAAQIVTTVLCVISVAAYLVLSVLVYKEDKNSRKTS